jgi:hypothetical protein
MKIQARELHEICDQGAAVKMASAIISDTLDDVAPHILRVEIYLRDRKARPFDCSIKLCMLEARLQCQIPIAVVMEAHTMEDAIRSSAEKLKQAIAQLVPKVKHYPKVLAK